MTETVRSAVLLVIGVLGAALIIGWLQENRRVGAEAALGPETTIVEVDYQGLRIASSRVTSFPDVYAQAEDSGAALWLGNSQLHSINQYHDGEVTAPFHATEDLEQTTWALSLPNANLQEHLVVFAWSLSRRAPRCLVLPLVYDDLREDGMRPGMETCATESAVELLRTTKAGARIADELTAQPEAASPNAPESDRSWQQRSEQSLDTWLTDHSALWKDRPHLASTARYRLYDVRNAVFGISSDTKRRMLPVRYQRNMEALNAILELAAAHEVAVLTYIVPLRWDVEPPYALAEYRDWKETTGEIVRGAGGQFADLDRLVPDALWGSSAGMIDFMHFQAGGHELLGRRIAELIQSLEPASGR